MDALFQTQSNELSTITQKEKLFKDAERQWNTLSSEKGAPGRKVDFEIYKSILYNLEIRKVYLDSKLSLEKFSSIVGTNTTYLSNAVNNYFGCNFKQLLHRAPQVLRALITVAAGAVAGSAGTAGRHGIFLFSHRCSPLPAETDRLPDRSDWTPSAVHGSPYRRSCRRPAPRSRRRP